MLSYNESLKILKETNALLEGHFILSSGLHSNQYVQCAKLLSYPKQAEIICASLTEKIKNNFNKIDIVLSPALGGIVVGYEVGRQLKIKTISYDRSSFVVIPTFYQQDFAACYLFAYEKLYHSRHRSTNSFNMHH